MLLGRALGILCAGLLAVSCQVRKYNIKSDVSHAADTTGISQNGSFWSKITPSQMDGLVNLWKSGGSSVYKGRSNPFRCGTQEQDTVLTTRIQTIVDEIYNYAKYQAEKKSPGKFYAPRPKVYLINDASWNAFATSFPHRFALSVKYVPSNFPPNFREELDSAWTVGEFSDTVLSAGSVSAGMGSLGVSFNEMPQVASSAVSEILRRESIYLKRSKYECKLASFDSKSATLDPSCSKTVIGQWFASNQMLPVIFVNLGLLRETSFEEVTAVLAHEMAHYLWAHGIHGSFVNRQTATSESDLWSSEDGYLYDENAYAPGTVPKPLTQVSSQESRRAIEAAMSERVPEPLYGEQISRTALMLMTNPSTLTPLQFESPTEYGSLLRSGETALPFSRLLGFHCRKHAGSAVCDRFEQLAALAGAESTAAGRVQYYDEFSKSIMQFASKIGIRYSSDQNAALCREKISPDSPSSICGDFLFSNLHNAYPGVSKLSERTKLKMLSLSNPTLFDWFHIVKTETGILWSSYTAGKTYLQNNRIGWYNSEQQADDASLEFLAGLGIAPKNAVEIWVRYAERETEKNATPEALVKQGYPIPQSCRGLWSRGFKDENNNWLAVRLLSDWDDSHHSYCYRAFNMTREIFFHNYQSQAPIRETLKSISSEWIQVQSSAQAALQGQTCR
jgi:hypothetical protein